jgi:hypothetical protein
MERMPLLVKNMVCRRCILAVEDILHEAAIPFQKVLFGEIFLKDDLTANPKKTIAGRICCNWL